MKRAVVLDAEALSALAGRDSKRRRKVRVALQAAAESRRDVIVPAVITAELYRGHRHSHALDACLAREPGIGIRPTDQPFARLVGGVLDGAGVGSEYMADAHAVAAAVETGGGVILTGDEGDLAKLAAPYPHITIQPLP